MLRKKCPKEIDILAALLFYEIKKKCGKEREISYLCYNYKIYTKLKSAITSRDNYRKIRKFKKLYLRDTRNLSPFQKSTSLIKFPNGKLF